MVLCSWYVGTYVALISGITEIKSRDGWYWNFSMLIIAWLKITIITIIVSVYACVIMNNK